MVEEMQRETSRATYIYRVQLNGRLYSSFVARDIYSGSSPPPGGEFLPKLKNREEFEGLEKRKGNGGRAKTEKSDKTQVKYLY